MADLPTRSDVPVIAGALEQLVKAGQADALVDWTHKGEVVDLLDDWNVLGGPVTWRRIAEGYLAAQRRRVLED